MDRSLAVLSIVLFLAACSFETKTPDVQKLELSELHVLGASCQGDFYSVSDGEVAFVQNNKRNVMFDHIQFSDLGSHRIAIKGHDPDHKSRTWTITFVLEGDTNIAKIVDFAVTPELTKEQLTRIGQPPDFYANLKTAMINTPKLVLCPRSET